MCVSVDHWGFLKFSLTKGSSREKKGIIRLLTKRAIVCYVMRRFPTFEKKKVTFTVKTEIIFFP